MIALIAHDKQKPHLVEFVRKHIDLFRGRALVATGNTGKLLREELGLEVERVVHGPEGGDLIIGGRVALGGSRGNHLLPRSADGVSPTSRTYRH